VPDPQTFVERYVALWNEPDTAARRAAIRQLSAADGTQVLEPPEDITAAAAVLGFPAPLLEVRGHDELEVRVTRAHEEFVAPGRYAFRARRNAARLRDVVKFNWEMVEVADGTVAAVGLDVFVLDGEGRIRVDHQWVEPG
jgi:hypothetical protein